MAESKKASAAGKEEGVLSWLQLVGEARRTVHATMGGGFSGEFWQHVRASRKERLLALRSLVDGQIARLEQQEEEAKDRRATKITVQ